MLLSKYLNKYYVKYLWLYIIGVISLVFVDYIQLFIPQFLGEIVKNFEFAADNGGFTEQMIQDVSMIVLYTLLIGVGLCIGRIVWRITIFRASQKIEADLRHDMFNKAERLSVSYYHHTKVGVIMSWFTNDLETLEEYLGFGVVMMIDSFVMGTLCIIKMFLLTWQFTLLSLLPMSLIIIWGALVEKFMEENWRLRQQSNDDLYDYTQESFTGIRVIKAFVKQRHELRSFAKAAEKNRKMNIKFATIHVTFDIVIEIVIGIIFSLVLWIGGYAVLSADKMNLFGQPFVMDASMLVSFIGYFDSLIWPLIALGQIVSMFSRSKASLKRVEEYMDIEENIRDCDNPIELTNIRGKIEFKDFTFKYPSGSAPHIKNVTLTIQPGESIGVVGRIGCGKTTLVNSLLRFFNLQKGQVFIDGVDLMDASIKSVRNNIGYVPQDNFLFSDTVKGNISFSDKNLPQDKIEEAAKFACVAEDIEGFAEKYDTMTGERGVTLSGGQKQRISIARAFIKDSPILIFDDSVSAVDVKTEETILHNIKEVRKGKTTIVVASRISTVSHLDKIIVLNDGNLEAFDTPENLMEISPTYKKIVYLQKLENEVEGR